MNWRRAQAVSVLVVVTALAGSGTALTDPASSDESAWTALPPGAEAAPGSPLERRGEAVFRQRCIGCHGPIPESVFGPPFLPPMPGTQALRARYGDALPAELAERTDLTAEFVAAIVRTGLPAMPFFRPTEVSDEDLEAVAAYLTRLH
jgi:mono/diheme cytochrome c family protein